MINKHHHLIKIILLATILAIGGSYVYADWTAPPAGTPGTCPINDANYPACNPPINTSVTPQTKEGGLGLGGAFSTKSTAVIGHGLLPPALANALKLKVFGKVGAEAYCDQDGNNCITPPGGAGGGFWQVDPSDPKAIINTNPGQVALANRIRIAGGKPEKGKVLAAIDNTGLARWRYITELPGQSTLVVSCAAGKAIQSINPDGTPVCVDLQSQSTSNGTGFIIALLTGSILNNILNSNDSNDTPTSSGGGCYTTPTANTCYRAGGRNAGCTNPVQTNPYQTSCTSYLCC